MYTVQVMNVPSVMDVARIAAHADPIVRNLQITQCYHELSQALARCSGPGANWCTFATWASKQAGQTIRGEDLALALASLYEGSPEVQALLQRLQRALERLGERRDVHTLRQVLLEVLDPQAALRRAAAAVARGNLKVFQEIGHEFARFLATFGDGEAFAPETVRAFCAALRPGEPPQGQRLLSEAFTVYAEACLETDPRTRAEAMFLANLLVGLHEQTRLQPEIAAALEASFGEREALRRRLLRVLLPGFWLGMRLQVARLLKGRLPLDVALDRLIGHLRQHVRQVVSEALLRLHLPEGQVLRLGRDLDRPFPAELARLAHPKLRALLAQIDPTPESRRGSGTDDWGDLRDRMHFIAEFFRSYHTWAPLFETPFTAAQVEQLKAGRRPGGRL